MDEFVKKQSVKDTFERYGATDDAIALIDSIPSESVERVPCHCRDCIKTGATSMFPGMLYCREFRTCVSPDEFCKRGQPEVKKDV